MKFHDIAAAEFVVQQLQLELDKLRAENAVLKQKLIELMGSAK